jgi:hypothetical protein
MIMHNAEEPEDCTSEQQVEKYLQGELQAATYQSGTIGIVEHSQNATTGSHAAMSGRRGIVSKDKTTGVLASSSEKHLHIRICHFCANCQSHEGQCALKQNKQTISYHSLSTTISIWSRSLTTSPSMGRTNRLNARAMRLNYSRVLYPHYLLMSLFDCPIHNPSHYDYHGSTSK